MMNLKTDSLSKILYVIIILALVILTGVIIGLPWVARFILEGSTFYSIVNHTAILILLYITGIPTWIILWMTKRLAENRVPISQELGIINDGSILNLYCNYEFRDDLYYINEEDVIVILRRENNIKGFIDISILPKGLYFVQILTKEDIFVHKIIKD